ncbi:hypothetical protein DFR29_10653 [Tahibacter aquaticus]|uniref:Uncharacterized protein n=1 Tax=Tahibacter aquaticus TaxID=520092 RepID=A0A4R6YY32_9GAMM|nr:hypothetical protein DFR29_10653 [Tahibacter aquaticus]
MGEGAGVEAYWEKTAFAADRGNTDAYQFEPVANLVFYISSKKKPTTHFFPSPIH